MKTRKLLGALLEALLRASLVGAMFRWAVERRATAPTLFTWFAVPSGVAEAARHYQFKGQAPLDRFCETKVHPPESIPFLGNDCYIGSSESRQEQWAGADATREVCARAGIDLNSQTKTFHVQAQLDVLLA